MPGKGIEYALLNKKYRFDNIRQTVASHRDREREKERYMLAANRNMLQQQRANFTKWFGKVTCTNTPILHGTNSEP